MHECVLKQHVFERLYAETDRIMGYKLEKYHFEDPKWETKKINWMKGCRFMQATYITEADLNYDIENIEDSCNCFVEAFMQEKPQIIPDMKLCVEHYHDMSNKNWKSILERMAKEINSTGAPPPGRFVKENPYGGKWISRASSKIKNFSIHQDIINIWTTIQYSHVLVIYVIITYLFLSCFHEYVGPHPSYHSAV